MTNDPASQASVPGSQGSGSGSQARANYDRIAEITYEEAVQAITQQRSSLDELRTRTGALLSSVILATAFLGAFAAKGNGRGLLPRFYGPVILFGAAIALCLAVVIPYGGWFLAFDAGSLIDRVDQEDPPKISEVYVAAVSDLVETRKKNQKSLNRLFYFFVAAAIAVLADIIWWIVEIV